MESARVAGGLGRCKRAETRQLKVTFTLGRQHTDCSCVFGSVPLPRRKNRPRFIPGGLEAVFLEATGCRMSHLPSLSNISMKTDLELPILCLEQIQPYGQTIICEVHRSLTTARRFCGVLNFQGLPKSISQEHSQQIKSCRYCRLI